MQRLLILITFTVLAQVSSMASPTKLLKAMDMIKMVESLQTVEMGHSANSELNKIHAILTNIELESLSEYQLEIFENVSDRAEKLQKKTIASTSSCDYFNKIANKEITKIQNLITNKKVYKSSMKARLLGQQVKDKKYCPQYTEWTASIIKLFKNV